VVFTPASQARLKDDPHAKWRVLGLGVSKALPGFDALPAVVAELSAIVRDESKPGSHGVLPGRLELDEAFNQQSLRSGLREGFEVVHIASHFQFRPGNEQDSFLLLGDGSRLDLAQLKRMPSVFAGVDLLALSCCNTAMGDAGSSGTEVEGFGVLAQRQGAKAVLATLWPVADESTRQLMQAFYGTRAPGTTKGEAMRSAQLALLRGERYAHPYFWAPFILIGNWK